MADENTTSPTRVEEQEEEVTAVNETVPTTGDPNRDQSLGPEGDDGLQKTEVVMV